MDPVSALNTVMAMPSSRLDQLAGTRPRTRIR